MIESIANFLQRYQTIILWVTIIGFATSFVASYILFFFYHIQVGLTLSVSKLVTAKTVTLISTCMIALFMLSIGKLFYGVLKQ